ncbi:hypothetical protein GCM10017687_16060 [Streptomyces echinatus]
MSVGSDPAAVAAPAAALHVPMSTVNASSHLSTLRMRTLPCETDVRRKLSQQLPSHQRELRGPPRRPRSVAQHRIQPELTVYRPTAPLIQTQRCPVFTVTGPAWYL